MSEYQLYTGLKNLLERILKELRQLLKTKNDLRNLESLLQDYEELPQLVGMISRVVDLYFEKVHYRLSMGMAEQDYENLERLLQKNEGYNRQHIRAEQQLKLYSDSLQYKLYESEHAREQLLQSTKEMINSLKRDNQRLSEEITHLKEEARQNQQDRVASRQSNISDRGLKSAKSQRGNSLGVKIMATLQYDSQSRRRESLTGKGNASGSRRK